jgi:hypothetical protein
MHKTQKERQQEAIERNLARDARTIDEQLRLIRRRPGKSADETAKLLQLRAMQIALDATK